MKEKKKKIPDFGTIWYTTKEKDHQSSSNSHPTAKAFTPINRSKLWQEKWCAAIIIQRQTLASFVRLLQLHPFYGKNKYLKDGKILDTPHSSTSETKTPDLTKCSNLFAIYVYKWKFLQICRNCKLVIPRFCQRFTRETLAMKHLNEILLKSIIAYVAIP